MNRKYILITRPRQYWNKHTLEIRENRPGAFNALVESITINMFYAVTPDWFIIYDTVGGSGSGFSAGEMKRKIYIGDGEYLTRTVND